MPSIRLREGRTPEEEAIVAEQLTIEYGPEHGPILRRGVETGLRLTTELEYELVADMLFAAGDDDCLKDDILTATGKYFHDIDLD